MHSIKTLQQRIQHRTDLETLEQYSDRIADLLNRGEQFSSDRGLEQFVSRYLTDEVEKRDNGERGPLCSCRLPTCSIKRGVAPAPVRIRGDGTLRTLDTRRRAAEWVLDHPGDAAALQEALEEYDSEIGGLHADWLNLSQKLRQEEWGKQIKPDEGDNP